MLPFLAGTMASVVAKDGDVFRPTGITPRQIPLSLLSREDCAAICDAQPPPLSELWRVMPEFRRLLEGVGGWPRPLATLVEDASARLELAGGDPKQVLWAGVDMATRAAVSKRKFIAQPGNLSVVVICAAVLGSEVFPDEELPVAAGTEGKTWDVMEQQGAIHLQPILPKVGIGPSPPTKRVVLPLLSVLTFLEDPDVKRVPEELRGLRKLCEQWLPASGKAAVLTWQDFESLMVFWSGVRLELLGGIESGVERGRRRVSFCDFFGPAALYGTSAKEVPDLLPNWAESVQIALPARKQLSVSRCRRQFPNLDDAALLPTPRRWNDGQVQGPSRSWASSMYVILATAFFLACDVTTADNYNLTRFT